MGQAPDDIAELPIEVLAGVIEGGVARLRPALRAMLGTEPPEQAPLAQCIQAGSAAGDEFPADRLGLSTGSTLSVACDCLEALPAILRLRSPAVPAFAVSRTLLEASARIYWLCEPDAEPMELLRRAVNDALDEKVEIGRFIGELNATKARHSGADPGRGPHHDPGVLAAAEDLATWGPENGYLVHRDRRGGFADGVGEPTPGPTTLVDRLLRYGDGPEGAGAAHYRLASAVTHAEGQAAVLFDRPTSARPAEIFAAPSSTAVDVAVPVALEGFCLALDSVRTFFGSSDKLIKQVAMVMWKTAVDLGVGVVAD